MKFKRPVTPAEMSRALTALCEDIVPGATPLYIDVHPLSGAPADECFSLVSSQVATNGGDLVVGWILWELPTLFVEAEFHAVWRSPAGKFIDIAPKKSPTRRILFLEDPLRRYEGRQVNNVRRATSQDPVVVEYLTAFDSQFELLNRGERAHRHGEIHLEGSEAAEFNAIQKKLVLLQLRIDSHLPSFGPYSPCWCGSGKKVKWCHRDQAV
ncbi:MAG: hypothetical protein RL042_1126 [Nitrospirota bacterium]|jgi:hypothetical protein